MPGQNIVKMTPHQQGTGCGDPHCQIADMETIYKHPENNGPVRVNSTAYQSGWDKILGDLLVAEA